MKDTIEMGTISSRGQISIPSEIRKNMGLIEGQKVLFCLEQNTLLIRKVNFQTFEQLTNPLKSTTKNIKESEVNALIHKLRKKR